MKRLDITEMIKPRLFSGCKELSMILSVSRRTDIPCYYSEWFIKRLNAGFVSVRNPFNHAQVRRVILSPDEIDCIVFWTKDAQNIIPYLKEIDALGYKYYFQFTLTPYGRELEPNLRNKSDIEETFMNLSETIGKERVMWRYDPIILNNLLDIDEHKSNFERLCRKFSAHTNTVIISFVDSYAKLKTDKIRELTDDEITKLSEFIADTAGGYGLKVKACCEKGELSRFGIEQASCIDRGVIEKICNKLIDIKPDRNQREGCRCLKSTDVGVYNTCLNGCVYCYANHSPITVRRRCDLHNPNSELLIGTIGF